MEWMNDNDSNSDTPDIESLGGYSDDLSLWSLNNSNDTCTSTDNDDTSSLTTNSSTEDLSSILDSSSNQDPSSIQNGSSVHDIFSDFKSCIKSENDELTEQLDSNIEKNLESVSKVEEQEVDKKNSQSQSIMDFIDSNKLTENREDTQIPLPDNYLTRPHIHSSKQPRSIEENTASVIADRATGYCDMEEVTNIINPPTFDIHPDDSAVPKQQDKISDETLTDSNKLFGEAIAKITPASKTLIDKAKLVKLQEALNNLGWQVQPEHYYEVKDTSAILSKVLSKIFSDNTKYKMIKIKSSLTREFPIKSLDLDESAIPKSSTIFKDTYGDDLSKAVSDVIGPLGTWIDPSLRGIVVANVRVNKSLSTMGDGDDDDEEEEEEVGGEGEEEMDGQQHDQSAQMHHDDHRQSLVAECSQPHTVECSEAVNTGSSSELAGLQSTTNSRLHEELVACHIQSLLLSLLINSGGQITSVLPNQVTIDVHRQKIILTSDRAFFEECLHNGKRVGLPDCVASLRDYLTGRDVHSTAMMIDNTPTVIGLVLLPTSISDNILGDTAIELVRRSQKDSFLSKIFRRYNNNNDESVAIVSNMDPESNHSVKEDTVVVSANRNNFVVNCNPIQASSPSMESLISGQACANENEEKLILAQRRNRRQTVQPCTAGAMPAAYIQGANVMSTLQSGSNSFSRTYNTPRSFFPPPCGEPHPLTSHSIEDDTNNSYPVNCIAVPASDNHSDPSVCRYEQGNAGLACGHVCQIPDLLISRCHGLRNVIEVLLQQDPEFRDLFIQMVSQQYQPCVVHSLPVINMGVVGGMPVLHVGSDSDPEQPEQWSKAYNMPDNFLPSPCGEPNLPKPSSDSNDDYPYNINCEARPSLEVIGQALSSSGSEEESGEHCNSKSSSKSEKFIVS